ncbi:MAG: hypothetical protein WBL27_06835 [Salinimicrobium sp.]
MFINVASTAQEASAVDLPMRKIHQRVIFTANVQVASKGEVTYSEAFGSAEAAGEKALSLKQLFNLGSVSKEFSAVGRIIGEEGKT